jgi:glycosyltransferase involved in cell wall biosynthesis
MRVIYYIRRIVRSGGTKVLFQHVRALRGCGIEAELLTRQHRYANFYSLEPAIIHELNDRRLSADIAVVTRPSDLPPMVAALSNTETILCHFLQGDTVGDVRSRLHSVKILRKIARSPLNSLKEMITLHRRIHRIEKVYRMPTEKFAVSSHLCRLIEDGYGQRCFEMPNGVDLSIFTPLEGSPQDHGLWRLISIGSLKTKVKGIQDVLSAVAWLKKKGYPVHLTRVSIDPETDIERNSGLVDSYLCSLSEREVAQALRQSDLLLVGSLEAEGFGLPALEAMACGIPCVLTRIPCYLAWGSSLDFAHFVPPRKPEEIVLGVVRLMKDRDYRERIRQRGFEIARRYSLDLLGDRLVAYFGQLLNEKDQSRARKSSLNPVVYFPRKRGKVSSDRNPV